MNYLMCSVGRRGELMKDFRASMEEGSRIIATDNSPYAPALYFADKQYIVPRIDAHEYIDVILDICKKEHINAVTTFIDPEIMLLAENRDRFAGYFRALHRRAWQSTPRLSCDLQALWNPQRFVLASS